MIKKWMGNVYIQTISSSDGLYFCQLYSFKYTCLNPRICSSCNISAFYVGLDNGSHFMDCCGDHMRYCIMHGVWRYLWYLWTVLINYYYFPQLLYIINYKKLLLCNIYHIQHFFFIIHTTLIVVQILATLLNDYYIVFFTWAFFKFLQRSRAFWEH